MQEEQLFAESGAILKNFHSLNLLCTCVSLFETVLTRQNTASRKNSQEFLASQVSVLRRHKATNSSTSNRPFFRGTESPCPCIGNLFRLFRLDIEFAREVCYLETKMKKIWQSSYSFHYPQWQTARANVMANLTSLNKLPNTRVFIAAENGSVEVLELAWLYFSSRREPSVLKTGRGFP